MTDQNVSQSKSDHELSGGNFLNYILDQLSDLENFTFKKMIGGVGFYRDNLMFGAISGGKFRLKSAHKCDGESIKAPTSNPYSMYQLREELYCIVPTNVLKDKILLLQWAEMAYQAALKTKN